MLEPLGAGQGPEASESCIKTALKVSMGQEGRRYIV